MRLARHAHRSSVDLPVRWSALHVHPCVMWQRSNGDMFLCRLVDRRKQVLRRIVAVSHDSRCLLIGTSGLLLLLLLQVTVGACLRRLR